ncbi:hypothetical protein JCM6882_007249 [Rhodosporidiobolus microsporus]
MCKAHTVLAYAINVSTPSLLEAADAFPHLEPTLPFFQLISLRIREGRLQAQKDGAQSAVERLTDEVWQLIKREVVSLELTDARTALVEPLLCDECYLLKYDELKQEGWVKMCPGDCEVCLDRLNEFDGLRSDERQKRVRKLLTSFNLALPTTFPVRSSKDASSSPFLSVGSDPTTATFVSLPLSTLPTKNGFVVLEAECGGDSAPDEQAIVNLTPFAKATHSSDSSITARFRALVDLFQLDVIEASDGLLAIEGTAALEGKKKKVLRKRRFKHIKLEDMKPKWKLFTTCETTW